LGAEVAGLFVMLLSLLAGAVSWISATLLAGMGAMVGMLLPAFALLQLSANEGRLMRKRLTGLGLGYTGRGTFSGAVENWPVRYTSRLVEQDGVSTRVHGWGAWVPSGTLQLASRKGSAHRAGPLTGDRRFDRRYAVRGDLFDLAWLTAPVREMLMQVRCRVRLDGDYLWFESEVFRPELLHQAISVARALSAGFTDPQCRLSAFATGDPMPSVRRRLLIEAAARGLPEAATLARASFEDEDEVVRAEAAIVLQDPERMLEAAADRELPLELRRRAAAALLSAPAEHRLAAGEALSRMPSMRGAAVALLRSMGAQGEAGLLELVPRVDGEMLGHVVAALAAVGSVAAVPALRARQSSLTLLQSGLRAALDHAVLTIQSGAKGERGTLSLAGAPGAEGALSLASADTTGALAIARDPGEPV
jgi:hypothetical protein